MTDISDYIGNTDRFPVLGKWNFLNHAGVTPFPKTVADAMRKAIDHCESNAYLDTDWFGEINKARETIARFVNASTDEIALVKNTSEAISIVAQGLDWKPGDRVISANVEYPANVYPWMEAERKYGIERVMVPEETDEHGRRQIRLEKIVAELEHPKTRLLTLSHVEFASGQRHDIATLGNICRERGILFCVDGIQSLGAFPVDVQAMKIDFLAACGHKWMCGPLGAGLFFIRRDLLDRVRPLVIGANSVINDMDYGNYDYTFKPNASRHESGAWNLVGVYGFRAALEMLMDVGIPAIADRLKLLSDRLITGLELKGYQIISPRLNNAWSGMVCFTSAVHAHDELVATLRKDHRIELAVREKRVRCSPHFYNTEAQVDAVIEALPSH